MRNYLVVANQTLAGEHLIEEVARRTSSGPSMFHVVVPAAPNREQVTWSEGEALAIAQQRLDAALQAFRALLALTSVSRKTSGSKLSSTRR